MAQHGITVQPVVTFDLPPVLGTFRSASPGLYYGQPWRTRKYRESLDVGISGHRVLRPADNQPTASTTLLHWRPITRLLVDSVSAFCERQMFNNYSARYSTPPPLGDGVSTRDFDLTTTPCTTPSLLSLATMQAANRLGLQPAPEDQPTA